MLDSNARNASLDAEIRWYDETEDSEDSLNDWDLYLEREIAPDSDDWEEVTSADNTFLTTSESLTLREPPPGTYRIAVVNCAATDTVP